MLKVLVACEESQRVCSAFRKLGHEAYSCDLINESGNHPEWHIKGDCLSVINGNCDFVTRGGQAISIKGEWDLIVAHPPCTYLSHVATWSHSLKHTPLDKINNRTEQRIEAMKFFMAIVNAKCEHIAVENPVGVMNTCYRSPDQIIEPYMFAESVDDVDNYVTKRTCLWLKGLPLLNGNDLPKPDNKKLFGVRANGRANCWMEKVKGDTKTRAKIRSKTFTGIANAIAEQWGEYLENIK